MKTTSPTSTSCTASFARAHLTRLVSAFAAILLVLYVTCACGCTATDETTDNENVTATTVDDTTNENSNAAKADADIEAVAVVIDATQGGGEVVTYQVSMADANAQSTVLEALEAAAADNNFEVDVEDSDYGAYVTSIDGIANGSAGSSSGWTYTVNGESIMESAGTYEISSGDTVEWTFVS